uniref:Transcription factor TFIIIC triple barrel domain-containing protein n=1 Tax=Chromera velia CCMP2878 TaxID=1169474 RepID=A0A0G4HLW6_9ALVE|mmetsp:Transcript_55543/g.108763  ORF Transcript_55543/g.108763 Transcript_55543/m.108763 type:complete len:199 (-) Transcript_55543:72-668(-)|eukprot:Cvel_7406.t1-p1 / transcript=Cvel_7406.t1 / gene=Cvel_7406 / organism=Chromera_velia_CCMP2878 / gene_product=hypothetical protein / transcript_product=hypothetical protein / location=Cvel_scaffold386:67258-68596(+) / protein_length=198 / sequence_SO=supercontig / SO=protein_coding / is_pseudo=false
MEGVQPDSSAGDGKDKRKRQRGSTKDVPLEEEEEKEEEEEEQEADEEEVEEVEEMVLIDFPELAHTRFLADVKSIGIENPESSSPSILLDQTYLLQGRWEEAIGTNLFFQFKPQPAEETVETEREEETAVSTGKAAEEQKKREEATLQEFREELLAKLCDGEGKNFSLKGKGIRILKGEIEPQLRAKMVNHAKTFSLG